jgi:MFS family permease
VRLRSSFIYLANAVNDLRGNWTVLAIVLAPMVLAAALCLLPDALNLQFRLATAFEPGTQNINYQLAQTPDAPAKPPPALKEQPPYSPWITTALHLLFALLSVLVTLVALCSLARIQAGTREAGVGAEAIEVYRRAIALAPAFLWITFLQLLAPAAGLFLFQAAVTYLPNSVGVAVYIGLVLMIIVGALIYLWLYFAQFALVFDGKHSWHALLFSRDLMRKRFFKVGTRIVVFLAVWSGFNSWAAGSFVVVSLLFGPVGVVTGFLGTTIFIVDVTAIAVSFATAAFFVAAGLRLYQDLIGAPVPERPDSATQFAMQPTGALS